MNESSNSYLFKHSPLDSSYSAAKNINHLLPCGIFVNYVVGGNWFYYCTEVEAVTFYARAVKTTGNGVLTAVLWFVWMSLLYSPHQFFLHPTTIFILRLKVVVLLNPRCGSAMKMMPLLRCIQYRHISNYSTPYFTHHNVKSINNRDQRVKPHPRVYRPFEFLDLFL